MYTVYSLVDPRHSTVRYIGITEDVYARFQQHLRGDENIDKSEWIQELRQSGMMLLMYTIETVETLEEAKEREDHWIHHHLSKGAHLLNIQISRSFTYDDFLVAFGKKRTPEPSTPSPAPVSHPGEAAKRVQRLLKSHPELTNAQVAKRAKVTASYVSRIRKLMNASHASNGHAKVTQEFTDSLVEVVPENVSRN